ncbi:type II secretion system F family protein [Paenalcaligenes sp. Me52]|uniref:type II secretion system F family protein n=1 Tax=Paenalcaligenes sp. Me52 TaxID=3392038 RepID=UPI003D2AF23D
MQGLWGYISFAVVAITTMTSLLGIGSWLRTRWRQLPEQVQDREWHQWLVWLHSALGRRLWVLLPWRWRHRLPLWLGIEQHAEVYMVLGRLLLQALAVAFIVLILSAVYGEEMNLNMAAVAGGVTLLLPWWKRYQERQSRLHAQRCQYPFFLDVLALSVESGAGVMLALQTAAESLPSGDLQRLLQQALFRMRSGMSREQSFERLVLDSGLVEMSVLSANLDNAVKMGLSLSTVLRAQADQYRQERFLRAEKQALEAPVKMLFPVVSCILPCTFLVIAFPLVMQMMQSLF